MKSINYYITHPSKILFWILIRLSFLFSDELYLRMQYRLMTGKKLNLKNPQTFNEKLQWLKLYDRKTEYTVMVDKYLAKKYVADKIGEQYIIPTLGVWNKFEEIDFAKLPNQFVLKCTHDSGGLVICKDKSKFDVKVAKKKILCSLKRDYYLVGREWPYKNVPRRIIAEKFMEDESGKDLNDYKIFCFDGQPKLIQVDYDRFANHRRNYYDIEWNYVTIENHYPSDPSHIIRKPIVIDKMIELAKQLSAGIPHVRVDFYIIGESIYFGELTFYHASGFEDFFPSKWNYELGSCIKLNIK